MRRGRCRAGWIAVGLLWCAPAAAVSVQSWSASTAAELGGGTLDGTAIDEEGRVRLAQRSQTLWGPESGIVWGVSPAGDDGALVALSGPARVLRVEPSSATETWYEGGEDSLVTALVGDGKREAWFGVSPEGRVLHARRERSGSVRVESHVETGALFVWALARDERGALWVGTGAPGRLLRHRAGGDTEVVFESADDPVRSVAPLPGGGVVIGTGGRGLVVRIGPDDRPFVLLDADETEIVSVAAVADGTVFALAAQRGKQPSGPPPRAEDAARDASNSIRVVARPPGNEGEDKPEQDQSQPQPPQPRPTPAPSLVSAPGGALYRIDTDGGVRKVWQTDREMPFALLATGERRLLVATGDQGRLYAVDAEGRASRLLRIPSNQASAAAVASGGRVLVGGTTDARVERLEAAPRTEGDYASPAVDAGSVADWGRLRWNVDLPAGTRLRVEARSGNTAEPDDTWAPWVELRPDSGATAQTRVPAARWFQARFRLASDSAASPLLRRIEVSYQPRNRPPVVSALTVEPAGVVWVRGPVQSALQIGPVVAEDPVARKVGEGLQRGRRNASALRKGYEAGARTFTWQTEDPDRDRLRHTLEIRREGSDGWFALARELEDEFYSWDARGIPDGLYRVRLTVDDAPDNPNGTHRTAERISDAFLVDNTRPGVGEPEVRRASGGHEVRFVARDPGGSVAAVEVAFDGGPWTPLTPLDGVADSEEERYVYVLPPGDEGAARSRALMVRVVDAAGNLGGGMWRVP